jgi:aminopeptidase N
MVIGATDFAIGTITPCADGGRSPVRADGCVPVTYWAYPQDSPKAAAIFRRAGDMIEYFSRTFGAFPYEKLAHVQSATRFGGMENVGAIFYSEQAIAGARLGETTVAHETAHQWFGDGVTESHWSHMWLSEGFATYFGMQYFEHADGVTKFRELLANSARGYLQSNDTAIAMVDTAHVPDDDLLALLNTNSYNKGGQVLHMARGVVGDSAFFAGIARYWREHAYGNALTADLQRALEQESGQDLGWFFDQWVFRPGYPVYGTALAWDDATRAATVTVEQTQNAAWPTFRMPIEFEFQTAQGPVRRKAMVSSRRETLRFDLPSKPASVTLDPDGWVLKRTATR